ncbi:hypothetical protein VTO73DRAFT_12271 [Trametes versicolor]
MLIDDRARQERDATEQPSAGTNSSQNATRARPTSASAAQSANRPPPDGLIIAVSDPTTRLEPPAPACLLTTAFSGPPPLRRDRPTAVHFAIHHRSRPRIR